MPNSFEHCHGVGNSRFVNCLDDILFSMKFTLRSYSVQSVCKYRAKATIASHFFDNFPHFLSPVKGRQA